LSGLLRQRRGVKLAQEIAALSLEVQSSGHSSSSSPTLVQRKEGNHSRQDLETHRLKGALRAAAIAAKVKPESFDDVDMRVNEFRWIDNQAVNVNPVTRHSGAEGCAV